MEAKENLWSDKEKQEVAWDFVWFGSVGVFFVYSHLFSDL